MGLIGLVVATQLGTDCGAYGAMCLPQAFLGVGLMVVSSFVGLPALFILLKRLLHK